MPSNTTDAFSANTAFPDGVDGDVTITLSKETDGDVTITNVTTETATVTLKPAGRRTGGGRRSREAEA